MEGKEFNFSNLYLHHTYGGPKPNQSTIINNNGSTGLGMTAVNNWAVYDGLGSDAKVVAHAHGLHIYAGDWHNSFSLVFENERYILILPSRQLYACTDDARKSYNLKRR
jgi:hypothetical protein